MNTARILIVDDEVLIAEYLKDILLSLGYVNISMAHDKQQAIQQVDIYKPSLVLLDIRMEGEQDGIEVARKLNQTYKIPFIFITAHSDKEFIEEALKASPAGYITKPFKKMDVFAAVNLALNNITHKAEHFLVFKDGYSNVKIPVGEILYAESDGNYISLHTPRKKFTIRYSLDWLLENLPPVGFARVHRSYVVNTNKIVKTTSRSVFVNEVEIPLARGKHFDLGST